MGVNANGRALQVEPNGQITVYPQQPTNDYQLRVFGNNPDTPNAVSALTVEANQPPPVITGFSADKTIIQPGDPVRLSWTAENCWMVAIVNAAGDQLDCHQGSLVVTPNETTTYSLVVFGMNHNQATSSVTVQVVDEKTEQEWLDYLLDQMTNGG